MLVREATNPDRQAARELFAHDFGHAKIVAFGEVMDIDQMPALVAVMHTDRPARSPTAFMATRSTSSLAMIVWRFGVGSHLVAAGLLTPVDAQQSRRCDD